MVPDAICSPCAHERQRGHGPTGVASRGKGLRRNGERLAQWPADATCQERLASLARPGDPSSFTPLRPHLAHSFPVFPRLLRIFTVSPRRFQRAASRNPGPRKQWQGGPNAVSTVGLTPGVRNARQVALGSLQCQEMAWRLRPLGNNHIAFRIDSGAGGASPWTPGLVSKVFVLSNRSRAT